MRLCILSQHLYRYLFHEMLTVYVICVLNKLVCNSLYSVDCYYKAFDVVNISVTQGLPEDWLECAEPLGS